MNPEELFRGESETIEYKASVAPKSEAYMKTVIAFANGRGGQLLFGVQDVSGEAVGLGRKAVFKYMDAVANAIASRCQPRIHPHIYLYEVDRKPIIIVDVPPGVETPYWLQSEGMTNGTYIRVGATTRRADRYRIEELILRGQNKFYDQEITDTIVKESEAGEFCERLYEYAESQRPQESSAEIRKVGIGQLLSWGVLHEADHHFYASNGFLLLGGARDKVPDAAIQCAVYEGTKRGTTLERAEYNSTFYENIDNALQFVMKSLDGLSPDGQPYPRARLKELDPATIKEIIINAVCHRSYQTPGKTQVAVFDDRIEVVSPGGLDCSLAVEDIWRGRSRVRNQAIAPVFRYAGMFEGWGNGIPRLLSEMKEKGLPEPRFRARPGDFLVKIPAVETTPESEPGDEPAVTYEKPREVVPVVGLTEPTADSISASSRRQPYEFVPYDEFPSARLMLSQEAGVPAAEMDLSSLELSEMGTKKESRQLVGTGAVPMRGGRMLYDDDQPNVHYDQRPSMSNIGKVPPNERKRNRPDRRHQNRNKPDKGGRRETPAQAQKAPAKKQKNNGPSDVDSSLSRKEKVVLEALRRDPELTQTELTTATGLSLTTVRRALGLLVDKKLVAREGGRRYGSWTVTE